MNKVELIAKVAEETGFTKKDVTVVVDTVFAEIMNGVATEGEVSIHQFGVFGKKTSKERMGRNPKTGEEMKILPKTTPTFKAKKAFKDLVAE